MDQWIMVFFKDAYLVVVFVIIIKSKVSGQSALGVITRFKCDLINPSHLSIASGSSVVAIAPHELTFPCWLTSGIMLPRSIWENLSCMRYGTKVFKHHFLDTSCEWLPALSLLMKYQTERRVARQIG
ncbi:unnamed protein product [Cuscuta epithymum]|uniref:Uncharacterized protein n=1 Tax=Cuscuta epithymum TaxID=186058 RepID=A0AAV0DG39_9ASTE|nr:unnamed protein product [Cuscuta epithymum]